jgi:hypothetical protein
MGKTQIKKLAVFSLEVVQYLTSYYFLCQRIYFEVNKSEVTLFRPLLWRPERTWAAVRPLAHPAANRNVARLFHYRSLCTCCVLLHLYSSAAF